jgi:uncharacterized protein YndB with AHSA1/START domain
MAKNKPNELYLTRTYDAPLKMVWDAWVDPKQAAKWWGPRGFTITTHSKDLKPGGHWSYTMHGPDGVDYENTAIYHEVEKYSRLVYDHGGQADRPPMFKVTVNFSENANKTKIEMTMAFATPELAAESKKFIKKAGGEGTWDRLAEYLSEEISQKDIFVINRSFDTSINTMFEMWTDPKHVSKWMPPTGFDMEYLSVNIKPGGQSFYKMSGNGLVMYGKAFYKEITKPNRLVYSQIFCDKDGNLSRHPMAPTWPAEMLTTVSFAEEDTNKTRVTITWEVYGNATAEERATFHQAKSGMTQGWTGSFDKLEEYIEKK